MNKLFLILPVLFLMACGASSNNSATGTGDHNVQILPIPPAPHGTKVLIFTASRNGGTVSNATFTVTNEVKVYLPAPTDIIVPDNSAFPFDAALLVKNITCTYHHNGGSSTMTSVSCAPNVNQIAVSPGDSLLFTVNFGPSQLTTIKSNFYMDY